MPAVYRLYFEAVGKGADICRAHWDAVDAATLRQFDFVKTLGATAFRPTHDGGIRTLIFDKHEDREGWRYIGRAGEGFECEPRRSTKAGKAIAEALKGAPRRPTTGALTSKFVVQKEEPCDGTKIYWPGAAEVTRPRRRFFITVPLYVGSKWKPPSTLKEIRESEYLAAFEDHNAWVRRQQARKKAA